MKVKYILILVFLLVAIGTVGYAVRRSNTGNKNLKPPTAAYPIAAYKLDNIIKAYIHDAYEDKIIYELTLDEMSAIKSAFNEAFDTILEYEFDPENGWSPGISLTIIINEGERVNICSTPDTDQFLISYLRASLEGNWYISTEYYVLSPKLKVVYDAVTEKSRGTNQVKLYKDNLMIGENSFEPQYSSSGELVFVSYAGEKYQLVVRDYDSEMVIYESDKNLFYPLWNSTGDCIAFFEYVSGGYETPQYDSKVLLYDFKFGQ